MSENSHRDDVTFDAAWRAFADEDARLQSPPELEERVMAAIRQPGLTSRRGPSNAGRALALAAAVVTAVTGAVVVWQTSRVSPSLDGRAPIAELSLYPEAVDAQRPETTLSVVVSAQPERRARPRLPRATGRPPLPPALLTLGAVPLQDTESLQLVRLRLPREVLQALGVVFLEPELQTVVDVDVLVGEDGLPRDIRQVRARQE
jgi:hypothetical protein